ncbi:hypothetical protein BUALT_Bualt17G0008200 [Buddleja alternifolia]|uniref:SOUL heme-binding protein n=1 Tax=Buddleja alternifolia TaxID=168488 RepID=A0AAV6W5B8_9LAMI|nr:hypothetical protein BUALT_Bualt17G0008200 [Buddleja alternifolia]
MGSLVRTELSIVFVLLLSLFHLKCHGIEEVKGYPASVNCATQECAPYKVIQSQKEFEIRVYNNSTWVSSPVTTSASYKDAVRDGFITLFNYVRGYNRAKVNWNMTAPVLTEILPKSSFQVYFYLPKKLQNNPPPPYENQHITPVKLPRKKFGAVTRFSGYLDDANIAAGLSTLKKNLKGTPWQSASASSDYSAADYNPPYQVKDRVNEVILWFDKN